MDNSLTFLVVWKEQAGDQLQDYIQLHQRFFTTIGTWLKTNFQMTNVVPQPATHTGERVFQAVITITLLNSVPARELHKICSTILHQWCFMGVNMPFTGYLQWLIPDRERAFWRGWTPYERDIQLEALAFGTLAGLCLFAQSHFVVAQAATPGYTLSCAFNHDERLIQVILKLNHSPSCRHDQSTFKLEISYSGIFRVIINEAEKDSDTTSVYLQLVTVPLLYRNTDDPVASDAPPKDQGAWYNRVFQLGCPCWWVLRSTDIGGSSVIMLKLKNKLKARQAISRLSARCKRETTFQYCPMLTLRVGTQLKVIKKRCSFHIKEHLCFSTCYALSAVLQQGNNGFAQMALLAPDQLEKFEQNLVRFCQQNNLALESALFAIRSAIEEHEIVDIPSVLPQLYAKFCIAATRVPNVPAGTCLVRRAVVTPSRVLLLPPQIHSDNRILRKFDPEYSLRVSFRDDDLRNLSCSWRYSVIERVVRNPLREGLVVGDRQFKLLATSCSQLRDHGAWFYATDPMGYSTDMIRYWMGDFSDISSTAKKMARMGQCFSSTAESVRVPLLSDSVHEVPDVVGGRHPVKGEQYIFSDGIGMISLPLIQEVCHKLSIPETPSAIQVRYAGYKGMLCVNPALQGKQLVLRKSMRKFNCVNSDSIEVIKISAPRPVFLNRQLITLLEQLGVPSRVFFGLQQRMVMLLTDALLCDATALQVLETYVCSALPFAKLLRKGFSLTRDPFIRSMLFAVYRTSMESLMSKSRIAVPQNLGRNMFGVLDDTKTLKYGEVFVQFTHLGSPGGHEDCPATTVVTGTVLVTKCPCLHPGDVRKFTAVEVQALHHVKDCIVFPAEGPRPHPDEMAGSDLDGDEYIVIWDKSLFFPGNNRDPMVYGNNVPPRRCELGLVESMATFISDYIMNDNVGIMSNAHLALADKLEDGVFSGPCLSVAEKISICLDFAKTGIPAMLEKDEKPLEYPDFMQKGCHKNTYRSTRVLGHLYRFQRFLESIVSTSFTSRLLDFQSNMNLLELSGWKRYKHVAEELQATHEADMDHILKQYGIKNEAEVVSGFISDVSPLNNSHYEKSNVEILVTKQYRAIVESTRKRFFKAVDSACRVDNAVSEEQKRQVLLMMTSACFMVTYSNAQKTCSSFPWAFADAILLVMDKGSVCQNYPECKSKNILVARLDDQLSINTQEKDPKAIAFGVVLKWATKEDLLQDARARWPRICKDCLKKLFAESAHEEEAKCEQPFAKPLTSGRFVTSFLRYVSSSSVVFPACKACSWSSQTHAVTLAALRTYSLLAIFCDLCHLGLSCDPNLHEPVQEIREGSSVRVKVDSPGFLDMLRHGPEEVYSLLSGWSGVQEVHIRRGVDHTGDHYIVVSSVGRDWKRWLLEELLLQPWFAKAVEKRNLEIFIRTESLSRSDV